jgi:glycosyltransferase involved in cell wall biosynthesis
MDELISVVVPIYNVELYLKKCIQSIQYQTYKNLEIILIDDGSTDGSGIICNKIAAKDKRVHVIHVSNGGVSFARNIGIKNALGKYIAFIDADDTIETKYIEVLYASMMKYKVDISFCNYKEIIVNNEGVYILEHQDDFCSGILRDDFALLFTSKSEVMVGGPVGKLFNAQILKQNKIKFDQNHAWREDTMFCLAYFKYVNSYVRIPEMLYNYFRYNRGSATEKFPRERLITEIYFLKEIDKWFVENRVMRSDIVISKILPGICYIYIKCNLSSRKESILDTFYDYSRFVERELLPYCVRIKKINSWKSWLIIWTLVNHLYLPSFLYYLIKTKCRG